MAGRDRQTDAYGVPGGHARWCFRVEASSGDCVVLCMLVGNMRDRKTSYLCMHACQQRAPLCICSSVCVPINGVARATQTHPHHMQPTPLLSVHQVSVVWRGCPCSCGCGWRPFLGGSESVCMRLRVRMCDRRHCLVCMIVVHGCLTHFWQAVWERFYFSWETRLTLYVRFGSS